MRIRIGKAEFEYFQGFKAKTVDFQYRDAAALGENGAGKTSLADGVFWVLWDKNSAGDKKFGIRPVITNHDSPQYGEPIRGLKVKVGIALLINGEVKQFRKEQHEVVKEVDGEKRYSYPNKYWIDDYAMPENKYKKAVEDIMPSDIFKMLTDLDFFNNDDKCKRTKRREMLKDMAGDIPQPPGHDDLIAKLNGHDLDAYKKNLTDRKKLYEDERHDNGVCIGEKQRDLNEYAQNIGDGEKELRAKRENAQGDVKKLDKDIQSLRDSEKERQALFDKVNHLTCERGHRESVLKNQTGPVDDLLAERAELERKHADRTQELVSLHNLIHQAKTAIESYQNQIDQSTLTIKSIRDEYANADSPNCSLCGQVWPIDKPKPGLSDIEARGNKVKAAIDDTKQKKADLQDELNKLIASDFAKVEELKAAESDKNARIAEIDKAIKDRPEPNPAEDAEWKELTAKIAKVKAEIGEPVSEQLDKYNADRDAATMQIAAFDKALARFDTIKEAKERVVELEAREKELSQLIADVNGELDEVKQFKVTQSKMIEAKVNGMFEHITWRLFEYYQNGDINDQVCVALLDGKPYPSLSDGEKMFANNDAANTLSDYYGVEVFRFVDHAESMTMPIEAESQVIRLFAKPGVKELAIEVEQEAGKAVA